MSSETIAKIAELLGAQRIAANVIVGVLILSGVGAAAYLHLPWDAVWRAPVPVLATTVPIIALVLVVFSYALAVTINLRVLSFYRWHVRKQENARAQRDLENEREARKRQEQLARAGADELRRQMLPHLQSKEMAVLRKLHDSEAHQASFTYQTVPKLLEEYGFVRIVATVGKAVTLYKLHADALQAVRDHLQDLQAKQDAAHRKRIEACVVDADEADKALLQLFGIEGPTSPDEPLHPSISVPVNSAIVWLAREGVVATGDVKAADIEGRDPKGVYRRVDLMPEAVEPVERLILGRPVARTSILLDFTLIASDGIPYTPTTGGAPGQS